MWPDRMKSKLTFTRTMIVPITGAGTVFANQHVMYGNCMSPPIIYGSGTATPAVNTPTAEYPAGFTVLAAQYRSYRVYGSSCRARILGAQWNPGVGAANPNALIATLVPSANSSMVVGQEIVGNVINGVNAETAARLPHAKSLIIPGNVTSAKVPTLKNFSTVRAVEGTHKATIEGPEYSVDTILLNPPQRPMYWNLLIGGAGADPTAPQASQLAIPQYTLEIRMKYYAEFFDKRFDTN